MDSGAVIYIPSFIMIGSGIQKLIRGDTQRHTHRQKGDLISLLLFFKNKEISLKNTQDTFTCFGPAVAIIRGSPTLWGNALHVCYTYVLHRDLFAIRITN
jgi:hypothetical protein